MWSVNDGALYLIGYVPIETIQQEGNAVILASEKICQL